MALTEEARHRLYQWVESSAGTEVANTMMEMLPPVGWADVARRSDLDHLEQKMDLRFAALRSDMHGEFQAARGEMHSMRADFHRELRTQLYAILGGVFAMLSAFTAVAAF